MTDPRKLTLEQVNDRLARVRLYASVGEFKRALTLQSEVWVQIMDAASADHPLRSQMIGLAYTCSMRTLRLCLEHANAPELIAQLRRVA